jgi:hypothetical protein
MSNSVQQLSEPLRRCVTVHAHDVFVEDLRELRADGGVVRDAAVRPQSITE